MILLILARMFFDLVPNFGTGVCGVIGAVIPSIAMLRKGGKRVIIAKKRDTGRLFCVFAVCREVNPVTVVTCGYIKSVRF